MATHGRHSSDAYDNFGYQLAARMEDATTWPCSLPGCTARIDPDGPTTYCSKRHEAQAKLLSTPSFQKRAVQNTAMHMTWVHRAKQSGFIRTIDTPFSGGRIL